MTVTINGTSGITDADGGTVLSSADLATQAEAQAGTDNTKIMTPLRAAQAISALVSTSTVLTATAGATYGAVGTYVYALYSIGTGTVAPGATAAGSNLVAAAFNYGRSGATNNEQGTTFSTGYTAGSALSGTWRCMGAATAGSGSNGNFSATITLWLRIS